MGLEQVGLCMNIAWTRGNVKLLQACRYRLFFLSYFICLQRHFDIELMFPQKSSENIQVNKCLTDVLVMYYLQDAYALCRVFKKSTTVAKIGEHYATSTSNQLTSNHSSSIDLYSDGRVEDFESSDYSMPYDACSPNMATGSSLDMNSARDGKWMQYLSEEAFNLNPPAYPNYGTVSYPPSKVNLSIFSDI